MPDRIAQTDFDLAVGLLYAAREQRADTYLKGCVNYIINMKPKEMKL